jgi:hypothetical protein
MAAFVASFLGGQPLLISGVTGPITVFNKTIYDIIISSSSGSDAPNYLHFMGWTYLWAAIFHWIAAMFNGTSKRASHGVRMTLHPWVVQWRWKGDVGTYGWISVADNHSQLSRGSNTSPASRAIPLGSTSRRSTSNTASRSSRGNSRSRPPQRAFSVSCE